MQEEAAAALGQAGAAPTLASSMDQVPAGTTSQGSEHVSGPVASCQPCFRA